MLHAWYGATIFVVGMQLQYSPAEKWMQNRKRYSKMVLYRLRGAEFNPGAPYSCRFFKQLWLDLRRICTGKQAMWKSTDFSLPF